MLGGAIAIRAFIALLGICGEVRSRCAAAFSRSLFMHGGAIAVSFEGVIAKSTSIALLGNC